MKTDTNNLEKKWSDHFLDQSLLQGDEISDQALSDSLESWSRLEDPEGFTTIQDEETKASIQRNLDMVARMMSLMKSVLTNEDVHREATKSENSDAAAKNVTHYLSLCGSLPRWSDTTKIQRAEQLFQDSGVLSCVLFFCSSLPEVYVVPDISTVLHATGNLERITDQRIRSTAVMILAVMMPGGLYSPQGSGRPQVLKARFIHSVIRNLILRANPARFKDESKTRKPVEPLKTVLSSNPPRNMFEMTLAHGWDPSMSGIPVNQEELGYTLLTFSYVYLRSLRRLGLGFSQPDEEAYLHCWNVVGSLLGVHENMMAHTMKDAKTLFTILQERARRKVLLVDPRPHLGNALIGSIEKSIRFKPFKPMASLIISYLTSDETASDLGFYARIPWVAKIIFKAFTVGATFVDQLVRIFVPEFSIARFLVRIVGYQLLKKVLTDSTQPIDLPPQLRQQISRMLHDWSHDPKAPHWMNALEDFFTTQGSWTESIQT